MENADKLFGIICAGVILLGAWIVTEAQLGLGSEVGGATLIVMGIAGLFSLAGFNVLSGIKHIGVKGCILAATFVAGVWIFSVSGWGLWGSSILGLFLMISAFVCTDWFSEFYEGLRERRNLSKKNI